MRKIKRITSYAAVVSLIAAGFILAGAPASRAASGPPQPHNPDEGGIGFPVFGLLAVAGIATIAIWQGIKDAKKKKKSEAEKEQELEEVEGYEEYFEFEEEESSRAEPEGSEEPEVAAEELPAPVAVSE